MPKLTCVSNYQNQPHKLFYEKGKSYDVDESTFEFLRIDSPDSFKEFAPKTKSKPDADTAVKKPPNKAAKAKVTK